MARGLPRDTENNPDHWEILLEFLSLVLCQHFPIVLKDFAIVYYVTMAPYNSKSMFVRARSVVVLSKSTRFVYQVDSYRRTVIDQFSNGFLVWSTLLMFLDVHYKADKEECDRLIQCFDLK